MTAEEIKTSDNELDTLYKQYKEECRQIIQIGYYTASRSKLICIMESIDKELRKRVDNAKENNFADTTLLNFLHSYNKSGKGGKI